MRTTRSNASLVIIMDHSAINSIDPVTMEFFKNCSTQVIEIPPAPFHWWWAGSKNYLFPVVYLFLKMNKHLINREIVVDMHDTLFQRDPFSSHYIRKGEIHFTRENKTNRIHVGKLAWPRCYFPNFNGMILMIIKLMVDILVHILMKY